MKNFLKLSVSCLLLSFLLAQQSIASVIDGPGLSLFAFNGERQIGHVQSDPLLLFVMIDNTGAAIAERANQANKKIVEQFSSTEAYKAMTSDELKAFEKRFGARDVPKVVLGSETVSLESLISIEVRNNQGDVVELDIRPLASNESEPGAKELQPHDSLFYQFVAEGEELQRLPEGIYYMAAGVDSRNQRDMWQGWAFSKTMTVKLAQSADDPGWADSEARAQLVSTYLLADQRFVQAENHARDWIKRYPDSIDAWGQLGESLYGQARHQQALDSFLHAVDNFRKKYGDSPAELPMGLVDRIDTIAMETGIRPPLNPDDPIPDENTPKPENLDED